jgi:DNA-binding CsgD family transcriptional regulator
MRYIFDFALVSSCAVGAITTVFAYAVFFRHKSRLERFFLAFLTSFTMKAWADAALIFLGPLLDPRGPPAYALCFASRLALAGTIVFIGLFMDKLAGILQSGRARAAAYSLGAAVMLSASIQFAYCAAAKVAAYADPYASFPADYAFYALLLYPVAVFFAFSKRIKNVELYRMIRGLVCMILVAYPVMIAEEALGGSGTFKVFPLLYLAIYLVLLFSGFGDLVAERRIRGLSGAIGREFADRFGITAREKEIILLMSEGLSNKLIAERLFISTATVKNHVHNILEKTGAVNRVELVRMASLWPSAAGIPARPE